ncbi:hypothetical protein STRATTON_82 [Erwinia phage vB_EamM_Stratton]|uniref:Uncharacterized protein n=1 Tax=Erwinia phage vB_EamM_Stratton TaxID=1883378 RepID=A0A1B2IGV9_9CAUD|nr:hypothetical protein STRATTON_82 [Erwinia phage vB_EamM_Stratton]
MGSGILYLFAKRHTAKITCAKATYVPQSLKTRYSAFESVFKALKRKFDSNVFQIYITYMRENNYLSNPTIS